MGKPKRNKPAGNQLLFPEQTRAQFRDELEKRAGGPIPEKLLSAFLSMWPGKGQVVTTSFEERFEGPIPHPTLLAEYDAAYPGLAEKIIQEWREESALRRDVVRHQMDMEAGDQRHAMRLGWTGQILGFLLIAGVFGAGVYLFTIGVGGGGFLAASSAIAIAIVNALYGKKLVGRKAEAQEDTKPSK